MDILIFLVTNVCFKHQMIMDKHLIFKQSLILGTTSNTYLHAAYRAAVVKRGLVKSRSSC